MMEHFGPPKPSPDYLIHHIDDDHLHDNINNLIWMMKKDIGAGWTIPVEVYNTLTGEITRYETMTEAASALGTNNVNVRRMINGDRVRRKEHLKIKEL